MSRISGFRERDFSRSGPPSPQRWAPAVRSKLAVPALEAGALFWADPSLILLSES
jgi:hypothetical protein